MKRIVLIATFALLSASANAQITITKSSLITAGHEFVQFSDTNKIAVKQGGMGALTWDFKNLKKSDSTVSVAQNAGWNPSVSSLSPGSNIILAEKGKQDYTFLNVNDSAVVLDASAMDTGTGPLEVTKQGFYFLRFPITYGTSAFHDTILMSVDSSYLGFDPDGPGPAPRIDSVVLQNYVAQEFRAVGHGKIEFPNSTFPDVLMVENINVLYADVYAEVNGVWTSISAGYAGQLGYDVGGDSSYRHMWWSDDNGKGLPVVQYDFDNGQRQADGVDYIPAQAQLSGLTTSNAVNITVYPNPTSNQIHFDGILNANTTVQVYAINGALVLTAKMSNGTVDVSQLTAGNYVMVVENGADAISTEFTKN